jgi:uncharacterized integral membrane protein
MTSSALALVVALVAGSLIFSLLWAEIRIGQLRREIEQLKAVTPGSSPRPPAASG